MNQIAERTERLPMDSVGIATSGTGSKIAPQNLAEVVKFAEVMSRADIALPKHLRGNAGACMAVALQALDWQMNPFAVASKSYSVNGTIAYEAQLIIAVINTRSGIEGRITYEFEGEGQDKVCIARGKLEGVVLEARSPKFKDITPKNSPLWKSDPDQQHCYYTGRAWGRRFTPEVILGVYDRDEAEEFRGPDNAKDITPQSPVMQRLRANATEQPGSEREGFSASSVQQQTDRVLTGDIVDDEPHDPDTGEIFDNSASGAPSPASDDSEAHLPSDASHNEPAGELPSSAPAGSSDPFGKLQLAAGELQHLKDFARKALDDAAGKSDAPAKIESVERMFMSYRDVIESEDGVKTLSAMSKPLNAVIDGKRSREQAAGYIARDLLGCEAIELEGRRHG